MFGLMVVGVGLLYLLFWIGVTAWAHRWAMRRGYSKGRTIGVAFAAFLLMYLIPFWDHIPTLVAHKYSCEKEAGFWVYKTPEQWVKENPGVREGLPVLSSAGSPTKYGRFNDGYGETFTYLLNERFNWIITQQDISSMLPIIRIEQEIKDVQKNEVLARYVDFATGNSVKNPVGPPGPLKFWMRSQHCIGGERDQDNLKNFRDNFYGSKK